jgi:hypothetical protein
MRRARERIDIEQLLVWAYRDQQVDRMAGQMLAAISGPRTGGGLASSQSIWALGTRVDASGGMLAAIGATAPDDALVLHDAVLALGDMWIEIDGREVAVWSRAEIEAEPGWSLRETARGWIIRRPDARAIDMIGEVPVSRSVVTPLVVLHARAASRPETFADWQRPRGRPSAADRVREAEVVRARAVYCVWREALACLAETLQESLSDHEVTGPAASEEPWAG